MARADSVCTLFVGKGRSGKSFQQVDEMVHVWLPDETGPIWTNLPLHVEKVAEYVAKRTGKPAQQYIDRLHVIPADVLESWRDSARNAEHGQDDDEWNGPWDFFSGDGDEVNVIVGGRIVLDEAHHYWPFGGCVKFQKKWQVWVGELGHANCQLRLLTQDVEKLSECAVKEAAMKYEVVNSETERDPAFGILLKDWYELTASVTGIWNAACWVREVRRVFGKNEATHWEKYRFNKAIFALYESHSKPIAGGQSATGEYRREYQIRSAPGVWLWFLRRNWAAILLNRGTAKVAIILFLVFGGAGVVFRGTMALTTKAMTGGKSPEEIKKKAAAAAVPVQGQRVLAMGQSPNLIPDQGFQEAWIGEKRLSASDPKRIAELDEELKTLRLEIAAGSEVMALQPNRAVLRDGSTVSVGEEISSGPFAGVHVREIRFGRREVLLADGRMLRVGWHARVPVTAVEGQYSPDRASIPESVPRTLGQSPGQETIRDGRGQSNGNGGWYDVKRLRPVPREGLQGEHRDGGNPGRENNNLGRPRSANANNPVDGGTAGGGVSVQDGNGLLPGGSPP